MEVGDEELSFSRNWGKLQIEAPLLRQTQIRLGLMFEVQREIEGSNWISKRTPG